jgi:transposase
MKKSETAWCQQLENKDKQLQGQYLSLFQRKILEKRLQASDLGEQYRQRIEIMLLADAGKTQSEICAEIGCCHGTARHWILMARTGQAHNWEDQPIGRPKTINDAYLQRLQELVSQSPRDCGYPFRRWTASWLSKHLAQEFAIEVSDRHINRLLKQLGLSTRPQTSEPKQEQNSKRIAISDLSTTQEQITSELWQFQILKQG